MPIDALYPEAVVFVVAEIEGGRHLVGTAFLVGVPIEGVPDRSFVYAVTARHVVPIGTRTWLRINAHGGGIRDIEIPSWTRHIKDDVAIARIAADLGDLRIKHFGLDLAAAPDLMELGDRIYFIGLLARILGYKDANVPIVRSGTLARKYEDRIPISVGTSVDLVTAHLIDGFPLGGFSGSPCFAQYDRLQIAFHDPANPRADAMRVSLEHDTMLCGLVSGHFEDSTPADIDGSPSESIAARSHTGIGVITPVERILETLDDPELIAERQRRTAEIQEDPAGG